MNENETLREQMWDLCYGLLGAEEIAALHQQIKSDPAAARLYAEVRLQADLVASAAKIEDVSVTLSVPSDGQKVQPAAKTHSEVGESPFKPGRSGRSKSKPLSIPSYRAANWLAGLAATALLALIGYGFFTPARQSGSPADDLVVANIYNENGELQSGLTHHLKLMTTNRRGEPVKAAMSYMVSYTDGSVPFRDVVQTDEAGHGQLSLPGNVIQPGAVLELQAQRDKDSQNWKERAGEQFRRLAEPAPNSPKIVLPLAAKEEPVTSDVQFEKDSYQPGETFRFWVHAWRTFSNHPATPADQWKLVGDNGREIEPSSVEARPEAGIVSGEFQLPADAPTGNYRLVGINRKAGTAADFDAVAVGVEADKLGLQARRSGMSLYSRQMMRLRELDSLAMSEPLERAPLQKDTRLAMAKKESSEPMSRSGGGPPAPAPGGAPTAAKAPATSAAIPYGAALRDEKEKVRDGLAEKGEAGSNEDYSKLLRKDRSGLEEEALGWSGDVLVVPVPSELAGMNLRGVVSKAKVPVASQQYRGESPDNAKKGAEHLFSESLAERKFNVPAPAAEPVLPAVERTNAASEKQLATGASLNFQLPPEADGELDVTLFDQSVQPPKAVYWQVVHRASSRELNIDVKQEAAAFNPEQKLQVKLTATDRNGNAVPHSYFSARMMKADALATEATLAAANRYAAADKAVDGSRGRSFAPGMAGGAALGKGSVEKVADAKEGKKDGDEKKDDVKREEQDKESKLKAQSGTAKPGEPAAQTPPPVPSPAPAGPTTFEKNSLQDPARFRDPAEGQLSEDRAARDERAAVMGFSDESMTTDAPVVQEVLLASNDSLIEEAVRADEVAAQAARVEFQKMIGRVVMVVATVALLLFGLLAALHRPAQVKVWVPAMAVVAGSFAIGGVWLINGKLASRQVAGDAAFAPTAVAPAEFYKEESMPMARPDHPLPDATEGSHSNGQFVPGADRLGGMGPIAESPANGPAGRAEAVPAIRGALPGGGGGFGGGGSLGSGKPFAPKTPANKAEAAAKPAESTPQPSDPAAAGSKPRAEEETRKQEAIRMRNKESLAESAKSLAEPKNSRNTQPTPKPAAPKSALADAQQEKKLHAPALLWQPTLPANDKGEAELSFQLPAEAGDYVLLVDVQGPNGIGTVQKRIPVRVPAALPAAPAPPAKP